MIMADLGNGQFDGANLVLNFENLNPGNSWWKKYYDVYASTEQESERYRSSSAGGLASTS
ncbi:hypothetical protein D3C83_47360 [compost metagenome]